MKHHLVLYAPTRDQRSKEYHDATPDSLSLGNIGPEWIMPAALPLAITLTVFHFLHVPLLYQLTYVVATLSWCFLMFSYLHDAMHIEDFWLAKNRCFTRWFLSARHRHDTHHFLINDHGLMNKNFGIGCLFFNFCF